ncbi:MAG: hypothetical protein LBU36_08050 [Clostridiales bacterium]|jgi:hypothetical protein|nr:hypothetical protein [Clostridiales bacterium]
MESGGNDMEICSILSSECERRHAAFWDIIYKTVFAIVTILSLPFFIYSNNIQDRILLSAPPFFSCLVCLGAAFLLKMEAVRLHVMGKKRDDIIYRISPETKRVNEEYNQKMRDKTKTDIISRLAWRAKVVDTVLIIYAALFLVCLAEGILILNGGILPVPEK